MLYYKCNIVAIKIYTHNNTKINTVCNYLSFKNVKSGFDVTDLRKFYEW